ncbi:hypothetical protein MNBD_ALPHA01-1942 [hydrothermal vent metagenome]|uniref:Peptidase S8/S53 domain-containing protein n=1 Tax=hydrothermal vent metagenome TaxID=652676 RepID=A0A3B0RX85_9ZZZZ
MKDITVRLGLVDSGVSENQVKYISAGRCFLSGDGVPPEADRLGHGTAVVDIIRHYAPKVTLYNARVFDDRGVTTAARVAAALDWLVLQRADVINLSLGLQQDRDILRTSCARAVAAGVILVAASPARGQVTYPAAYDGVIRATGDARCGPGEISFLASPQADFGACPRALNQSPDQPPRHGGASLGAAHISGQLAAYLLAGGDGLSVREWLVSCAKYIHNERRTE